MALELEGIASATDTQTDRGEDTETDQDKSERDDDVGVHARAVSQPAAPVGLGKLEAALDGATDTGHGVERESSARGITRRGERVG